MTKLKKDDSKINRLKLKTHLKGLNIMVLIHFSGAQELGNVVRQNIHELQNELLGFKGLEPGTAASTSEQPLEEKADKGAVIDRFTREAVVISAPSKVSFTILCLKHRN